MHKFQPPPGRIAKMKADFFYRNGRKDDLKDEYGETIGINRPWEFKHITNLGDPRTKINLSKDRVFDTKNDGKPVKTKKETKADKLKKPTMRNAVGKTWHYH
tara:strand:+ start:3378 stop:3683 length:306 start_codon:yes stop_codon:yes gene_type:complete